MKLYLKRRKSLKPHLQHISRNISFKKMYCNKKNFAQERNTTNENVAIIKKVTFLFEKYSYYCLWNERSNFILLCCYGWFENVLQRGVEAGRIKKLLIFLQVFL